MIAIPVSTETTLWRWNLVSHAQALVAFARDGNRKGRMIDVGRSNDTGGLADNTVHDSSMDDQPVICSHPCMDSNCVHHPIAAPVDGTMCEYIDLFKSEGCVRKDD